MSPYKILKMAVTAKKLEELKARMQVLGLKESDFEESFVRGSGKGGQKVNKTNNCVCLIHPASGFVVRCHREREREINRFLARRALCDELEFLATGHRPQRPAQRSGKGPARSPNRGIQVIRRRQS